jgi:RNA polymerase sigma factor (sigma-70 family)
MSSAALARKTRVQRSRPRDEREGAVRKWTATPRRRSDNPVHTGSALSYDAREIVLLKPHPEMDAERVRPGGANPEPLAPETTIVLLALVKNGDQAALERLLERCIPALRRWARGRLPQWARGMLETSDLVQDAVMGAMGRLDAFEARYQGALQEYLRTAVRNKITDVIRQHKRRPERVELPETLRDEGTSPLDRLIGAENVARFDAAFERLSPSDRQAIVGRVEMNYSYEELATVLGKPSADAARMSVTRAMKRLAEELRHDF